MNPDPRLSKLKKEKYFYNIKTLRYEKIQASWTNRLLKFFGFIFSSVVFGVVLLTVWSYFFDLPKERKLKEEVTYWRGNFEKMDKELDQRIAVLDGIQERDKNIYRVIFNAEPIPKYVWEAGTGGSDKYSRYEVYEGGELISEVAEKIDKLGNRLKIQSESYDEIVGLIDNKQDMLASIPAIQPVGNKDLTRIASGFGMRIDPVYGTPRFHAGMDFTAPTGTPIYATGDGVAEVVNYSTGGYGNQVIIDHGYGYKTLYAHMSAFNVKKGQEVERGEIIGFIGSTGKSVGPHLHYEVIYKGVKVNPVNFFYNDLTDEEYQKVLEIAQNNGQALD